MNYLIEEIIASREWRLQELEKIRRVGRIDLYSKDNQFIDQYCKMCVPYIYAHWEGFVCETFKSLMVYLNGLKLDRSEVIDSLSTYSILSNFRSLSGKQSFQQCKEFYIKYEKEYRKPLFLDTGNFSTNSNLNYKQLSTIYEWFGLENKLEKFKERINSLVNQRNKIAHGENGIHITWLIVDDYLKTLAELFDAIILDVDSYVNNKGFLKRGV